MGPGHQALVPPDLDGRGLFRRFVETRGLVGDFQRPHVDTRIGTEDGVELAATYLPGPASDAPAVALFHGFGAQRRKPSYAYLADVLSTRCHVLALDLRGHARSGGVCTLGDREHLDAAAAVGWLRDYGHSWVGLVGASMGGTTALHALHAGVDADAAVVVSTPGWLRSPPETEAMKQLDALWRSPVKRALIRGVMGIRLVPPEVWQSPPHPVDAAASARVPVLVVHGEDDHFFAIDDAIAIAEAAGGVLWREPAGFGHAEDGFGVAFVAALTQGVVEAHATGRFPERDQVVR